MIGLVTVTYNSADVLPDFLASLAAVTTDVVCYVVDNDSSDSTIGILSSCVDGRLVVLPQSTNEGIAVGNNIGIRRAISDGCSYVCLINNDTSFPPDLFDGLVSALAESKASIVVPSLRYFDHPDTVWFEAANFATWRGSIPVATAPSKHSGTVTIECACTCCALIAVPTFDEVGLFDERYFVYWDDTDFFLRCFRAGVRMVLDPRLVLLHKVSSLTGGGDSVFSQRMRIQNRMYYIRKNHRGARRWVGEALTVANAAKLARASEQPRARWAILLEAIRAGRRMTVR